MKAPSSLALLTLLAALVGSNGMRGVSNEFTRAVPGPYPDPGMPKEPTKHDLERLRLAEEKRQRKAQRRNGGPHV